NIYKGLSPNDLNLLEAVDISNTIYVDTEVEDKTTYYYHITAVNILGESEPSILVNETAYSAPASPRELKAKLENDNVYLSWAPPSDDGGLQILEYKIYRGTQNEKYRYLSKVPAAITEYTDKDIQDGKKYYYYVTAENEVGESQTSNIESVSTIEDILNDFMILIISLIIIFIIIIIVIFLIIRKRRALKQDVSPEQPFYEVNRAPSYQQVDQQQFSPPIQPQSPQAPVPQYRDPEQQYSTQQQITYPQQIPQPGQQQQYLPSTPEHITSDQINQPQRNRNQPPYIPPKHQNQY
ncbi:MAG: fibronectin type III domain-containing protein, partial [Thermoplasmata archaeon]|nr:fibronectin type III domain-containing protein [Thermoplasmata archaeon]